MSTMIQRSKTKHIAHFPAPAQGAHIGALEIVAHDMRGPLANLAMLIEGMAANSRSGAHHRVVKGAHSAENVIQRLNEMLGAVLERARTGGDPLSFVPTNVDLANVVEQAATLNQPFAQSRWVRVHTYCVEPLHVTGDKQLLFEAIDNLISNAIKYTRPRSLVVCEAGPAQDGGVVVRISDAGPGLTDADRVRAFRPFTKLSAQPDAGTKSTGLGLWIARLIAKRHGGRIEATNRPDGEGAIFSLHLPNRKKSSEQEV